MMGSQEFEFDDSGFKELERKLKVFEKGQRVPLPKLFNPAFMKKYTRYPSFDALLAAGEYDVQTAEDFKAIPDDEWDRHIRASTRFRSWQEMQNHAGTEWTAKQLGFSSCQ